MDVGRDIRLAHGLGYWLRLRQRRHVSAAGGRRLRLAGMFLALEILPPAQMGRCATQPLPAAVTGTALLATPPNDILARRARLVRRASPVVWYSPYHRLRF